MIHHEAYKTPHEPVKARFSQLGEEWRCSLHCPLRNALPEFDAMVMQIDVQRFSVRTAKYDAKLY